MMNRRKLRSVLLAGMCCSGLAQSQSVKAPYFEMAPAEQYRISNRANEIALARSAAPPSISGDAQVLVLGVHGYETAVKGKNGFVCLVERSWDANFDAPEFWNPKIRGPDCFNPPAVRSELPKYLKRSEWILAGDTKQQVIEKTEAAFAGHTFKAPEAGAFSFMLSKAGYLGDAARGPWVPHVMFFFPHGQADDWGVGKGDSPIVVKEGSAIESTVVLIPVRTWSDGSPAPTPAKRRPM